MIITIIVKLYLYLIHTYDKTHSHPLLTSRTLSHKSSFIPRTCDLWNLLPSSCFPESYNLPSFKSKINKLDLISLSSQPFAFFFLPMLGLFIGHHGLSSTQPTRKKVRVGLCNKKGFSAVNQEAVLLKSAYIELNQNLLQGSSSAKKFKVKLQSQNLCRVS